MQFTLYIRPIWAPWNSKIDRPSVTLFSRPLFTICSHFLKCLFCLHHKLVSFVCLILCSLLLHLRRPSTVFALSPHFAIITRLNCSRWRCRVQSSISLFVCVHFYALLTQRLFFLSLSSVCCFCFFLIIFVVFNVCSVVLYVVFYVLVFSLRTSFIWL